MPDVFLSAGRWWDTRRNDEETLVADLATELGFLRACIKSGENLTTEDIERYIRLQNRVYAYYRSRYEPPYSERPKHGPEGNEGYCYCGTFVGHDGDWFTHTLEGKE